MVGLSKRVWSASSFSRHLEHDPGQLAPVAVLAVVIGQLGQGKDDEERQQHAQQLQQQLLGLPRRLRGTENLVVDLLDLQLEEDLARSGPRI